MAKTVPWKSLTKSLKAVGLDGVPGGRAPNPFRRTEIRDRAHSSALFPVLPGRERLVVVAEPASFCLDRGLRCIPQPGALVVSAPMRRQPAVGWSPPLTIALTEELGSRRKSANRPALSASIDVSDLLLAGLAQGSVQINAADRGCDTGEFSPRARCSGELFPTLSG
jgi:hypothetical protein